MPHVYNFRTVGVVKAGFKIAASPELCRVLLKIRLKTPHEMYEGNNQGIELCRS